MSLAGLFSWVMEQARYVLFIALVILILWTGAKRAWIAMIGALIGLAFIGIFIINPEILVGISEWATDRLNLR